MKKAEKSFFVDNLTEELKGASSVVCVNYSGLNVKTQQDLKKQLKSVNAKMLVVKNTLFKLAGKSAKVDDQIYSDSVLAGPTALIISEDDPIAPLQVVAKFAKEHNIPQLKVGIVEGAFQDTETLKKLSLLPSKDALVSQAIGAIASPMYAFVGTLQGNLQKLVFVLNEASKGGD